MSQRPKVLYFVTEDWYFCSHRMALAKAALMEGYDVTVLTRVKTFGDAIRAEGFHLIPLDIDRGGLNPLKEFLSLYEVWKVIGQVRPVIVHNVALKPVIYGGLACLFYPEVKSVNLIAGLGAVFSSKKLKARLIRPIVRICLGVIFKRLSCRVIVQNSEDRDLIIHQLAIDENRISLIKGSGVDVDHFRATPEPEGRVKLALVSRLLWDKGVGEFIKAIEILRKKEMDFEAILVGRPDEANLASISNQQLQQWNDAGIVKWLGYQEDIAHFWQQTHIAVLPTCYGEGVPKSLIEAAASGRPIVATDTAGCKEIVKNGENGLLVPVRNAVALADALEVLLLNSELRETMGKIGRKRVELEFSNEYVIAKTLAVYRQLIS